MRKMLVAPAALAAVAIAVPIGIGSSHREAPGITLDPSADNTDTYAFTAKDAPGALTFAANWIPGEVPGSARTSLGSMTAPGTTSTWTTPATARRTSVTGSRSRPHQEQELVPLCVPGANGYGDSEAQRDPAVLDRAREAPLEEGQGPRRASARSLAGCPWLRRTSARRRSRTTRRSWTERSGSWAAAARCSSGQRDDPFFVDLGGRSTLINVRQLTGNQGQGKDDLCGMNTPLVVMQLPESAVTEMASPSRPPARATR